MRSGVSSGSAAAAPTGSPPPLSPAIRMYMGDARDKALPLVSLGVASDEVTTHDWEYIFGHLGLLQHDTQIAAVVRTLGWLGMIATVAWMGWRSRTVMLSQGSD